MQILNIKDLTISFGHTPLLQKANLQIGMGEHIALVGRNGVGKSTLLKIIAGQASPDGGSVQFAKNSVISMLSQAVPLTLTGSVYDVVSSGLLSNESTEESWIAHQKIETILSKLSLNGKDAINSLSGGWKRRVLLARALVSEPDILLLDEPTNHLDIDAVLWLESFLKKYSKTFILITHDREFMSNLATRIIEIDYQSLLSWPGNYAHYCELKAQHVEIAEREQALFDKRLSEEEVWIRQGVKARRTRNEGRVRRLEALRKEKSQQFKQKGQTKFQMQAGALSGKIIFDIENVSFSYNHHKIINHFSAIVSRGDCVGIVGPNGSGKSTIIKLLLNELSPSSGMITRGSNLEVAYFDQYRLELDDTQTVIDNVGLGREKITINGKEKHVISYLQDFLFSPDRARSKVSQLSGGEKNRLLLAKLFSRPANLIVMDEPTNDLDIDTLELLEEKLADFSGTLLIVSHDRAFLNNVVTQLWVIEQNGHIQEHVGGNFNWETILAKSTSSVEKTIKDKQKNISQEEKRELNNLPNKITKIENEIARLQDEMGVPGFYEDAEKVVVQSQKIAKKSAELDACYERWQELENKS